MTVLGIDPALRRSGWAVLRGESRSPEVLGFGEIVNPPKRGHSAALEANRQAVVELIAQFQPDAVALEGIIFVQSIRTAIALGAARAASCMAASAAGIAIFEYPPARVKQAVTGNGQARKDQVAFMVRALLKLTATPPPDAADALAIALTHLQAETGARTGLQDRREL